MTFSHSSNPPATHYVKFYDVQKENEYKNTIGNWNKTICHLYKELKVDRKNKPLRIILWKMYQLRNYAVQALNFEAVDTDFANALPSEAKIIAICAPYSNSSNNQKTKF